MKNRKFNNRAFIISACLYLFLSYVVELGVEWIYGDTDFEHYFSIKSLLIHVIGALIFGAFFGIFRSKRVINNT